MSKQARKQRIKANHTWESIEPSGCYAHISVQGGYWKAMLLKEESQKELSLEKLKKLFCPIVQKFILKKRNQTCAANDLHMPPEEVLKNTALLSKWPVLSIKNVIRNSKICTYRKGCSIAYNKEPLATSSVFWVLSGKLMQVPSKGEIMRCALEIPTLSNSKLPKTGPLVFPSIFNSDRQSPATPLQESILDSLSIFNAGQLIDAELMVLGAQRRRPIRCLTDVTLINIPFSLFQKELTLLKGVPHKSTIEEARSVMTAALTQGDWKPSIVSILSQNSVLTGLSAQTLKAIWMQLQPAVLTCGEILCNNVYTSETVFFLSVGKVKCTTERSSNTVLLKARGACMGLNSTISFELPTQLQEKRTAVAASYCELWFISAHAFLCLCDEADKVNCSRLAAKQTDISQSSLNLLPNLRSYPVFASVSDDLLTTMVKSFKVRVYMAGDYIIPAKKISKSGVMILCGDAYLAARKKGGKGETHEPARVGTLYYVCEALVGVEVPNGIVASTSVIVALISAASILDGLERSGRISTEMESIMELAQRYVEKVYGGDVVHCKAQETAQKRVKAFNEKEQAERQQMQTDAQIQAVEDPVISKLEAENRILTSLSLQLDFLHHNDLDAEKYRYFNNPNETIVTTKKATETAQAAANDAKRNGCFTIDDKGNPIYCDQVPQMQKLIEEEEEEEEGKTCERAVAGRAYPQDQGFLHPPPVIPGSFSVNRTAHKKETVPSRDLYVPTVLRRPNDSTLAGSRPKLASSPPPRLAALRSEISQMKDDADGFDRRQEYRRQLFKKGGTI